MHMTSDFDDEPPKPKPKYTYQASQGHFQLEFSPFFTKLTPSTTAVYRTADPR